MGGRLVMKSFWLTMLFLLILGMPVLAQEEVMPNKVMALAGNENNNLVLVDYHLSNNWGLTAAWEKELLHGGIFWKPMTDFRLETGMVYDSATEDSFNYGNLEFLCQFGDNNLKLAGLANHNYHGKDWTEYEAVLKIQISEHDFYFDAGVRGDVGDGAPEYSYNPSKEPVLFLRGDLNWQWQKWGFDLNPVLLVNGTYLHDYTVKYQFNKNVNIVANINTLYDKEFNYQAGLEVKF